MLKRYLFSDRLYVLYLKHNAHIDIEPIPNLLHFYLPASNHSISSLQFDPHCG